MINIVEYASHFPKQTRYRVSFLEYKYRCTKSNTHSIYNWHQKRRSKSRLSNKLNTLQGKYNNKFLNSTFKENWATILSQPDWSILFQYKPLRPSRWSVQAKELWFWLLLLLEYLSLQWQMQPVNIFILCFAILIPFKVIW